jgi:hypothetical protein
MNKKKLLSEDLKRYRQLLEYTFYVPEETDEDENLLFDGMLTEQDPPADEEDTEDPFADVGEDEGFGDTEATETGEDEGFGDIEGGEETPEGEDTGEESGETDPFGSETEVEDEFADEDMGGEETIEVDVTDIVDKTEETKASVDGMGEKMEELLSKLSDLESQVTDMDGVINKIDDLEKEIERRNPTPVERLEMRSMDSFPYSVKLTDFWKDKEGYEATEQEEEFTLTQSDVDNFDEKEIRSSFESDNEEENN